MFQDLGLNPEYRHGGRHFEVDSAEEARPFGNVKADVLERVRPRGPIPAALMEGRSS